MNCKKCHKEIKDCLENLDLISNGICLECSLGFNVNLKTTPIQNTYSNKSLLNLRPHELVKKFGTAEEREEMKQCGIYMSNYLLREIFSKFIDYENMSSHNSFNELTIAYLLDKIKNLEKENSELKEESV